MTAQEALLAAAKAALASLDGVGVYDGPPVRASVLMPSSRSGRKRTGATRAASGARGGWP